MLGNVTIDKQHSKLFDMLIELSDLIRLSKSIDRFDNVANLLLELENYTITHFSYEESLMKKSGYPEKFLHRIEHAKFVDSIARCRKVDIDEQQETIVVELFDMLTTWITNHILTVDAKFIEWLNSNS